jgi:transcriptional regulator with XRE-family HTH domain
VKLPLTQWEIAAYQNAKPFSEMISERRKQTGVSLQELADLVGCSKTHLHMLEQGTTINPSAYLIWKLSDVLFLDPGECVESLGKQNALLENANAD